LKYKLDHLNQLVAENKNIIEQLEKDKDEIEVAHAIKLNDFYKLNKATLDKIEELEKGKEASGEYQLVKKGIDKAVTVSRII